MMCLFSGREGKTVSYLGVEPCLEKQSCNSDRGTKCNSVSQQVIGFKSIVKNQGHVLLLVTDQQLGCSMAILYSPAKVRTCSSDRHMCSGVYNNSCYMHTLTIPSKKKKNQI